MREDRVHQIFLGCLQVHGNDIALDQLRHFRADHVRAKQLAGFLIEDRLDQPVGLTQRDCLAVANEGEAADLDLVPSFLGFGFGQTDRRDLRIAIGAAGDLFLVQDEHRDRRSSQRRSRPHARPCGRAWAVRRHHQWRRCL
jgi:hypothetical protein